MGSVASMKSRVNPEWTPVCQQALDALVERTPDILAAVFTTSDGFDVAAYVPNEKISPKKTVGDDEFDVGAGRGAGLRSDVRSFQRCDCRSRKGPDSLVERPQRAGRAVAQRDCEPKGVDWRIALGLQAKLCDGRGEAGKPLAGCGKSPPASFSHPSEAQREGSEIGSTGGAFPFAKIHPRGERPHEVRTVPPRLFARYGLAWDKARPWATSLSWQAQGRRVN